MNNLNHVSRIYVLLAGLVWAGIAGADGWPTSVVGSWSVAANNFPGVLSITSQAATGNCRRILGTVYGNPIEGFYCPFSGRIVFLRKQAANNDTIQVWSGNLSQAQAGLPLLIGGSFASTGGAFGEYNWNASK